MKGKEEEDGGRKFTFHLIWKGGGGSLFSANSTKGRETVALPRPPTVRTVYVRTNGYGTLDFGGIKLCDRAREQTVSPAQFPPTSFGLPTKKDIRTEVLKFRLFLAVARKKETRLRKNGLKMD